MLDSNDQIVYLGRTTFLHDSLLTHKENWDVFVCPLGFISWILSFKKKKNSKCGIILRQVMNMRRRGCYFWDRDVFSRRCQSHGVYDVSRKERDEHPE